MTASPLPGPCFLCQTTPHRRRGVSIEAEDSEAEPIGMDSDRMALR